ncbi:MAG: hypothetical protein Q7T11_07265 [Deltaproteobacteria bacterium]|nr:hypothetical protein [Deltaproteobacteria bacterium]
MTRNYLLAVLALCLVVSVNSCSSSSGDDSTAASSETAAAASGAAATAIFGGMGGSSSVNEQVSIPRKFLEMFIKRAIAEADFTACDSIGSGPTDVSISLDGTDDSYGYTEPLVVADGSDIEFCEDGGDVAAWSIAAGDMDDITCTTDDGDVFISISGSGVFQEDSEADETIIRGNFKFGGNDLTPCSFNISHGEEEDFSGSCELNVDTEIDDSIECEDPGEGSSSSSDDSEDEDSEDSDSDDSSESSDEGVSCSSDDTCTAISDSGSCVDSICLFDCSTDSTVCDDLPIDSSCATTGENAGFCTPDED